MKFVIQRVPGASVKVGEEIKGKIDKGFLVLIGVGQEDTEEIADKFVKKLLGLRIFEDENGKTNLSLKDVNLHIKSGQVIGIIGGTGSAKSTLVQLIPRLYDVTKGAVKVGGIDVRDYSLTALRDQVSMVLQKNVLFTGTISDNIRWGDEDATDEEVERVQACPGRWFYPGIPGWLRHDDRRGRKQCIRRTKAEAVYRASAAQKTENTDPG